MSETQQIQPDAPLTVTLSAAQWNTVLTVLSEGPYRVVGPLIADIQRQCTASAREALPMHMPMRVNGAMAGGDARDE